MTEQKTVFVVTRGYLDDYCIVGVYDNPGQVEKVRAFHDHDDSEVVEWVINHPWCEEIRNGLKRWRVWMTRSGILNNIQQVSDTDSAEHEVYVYNPGQGQRREQMMVRVWAQDKERAVEITDETRTRLIASGEWDEMLSDSQKIQGAIKKLAKVMQGEKK